MKKIIFYIISIPYSLAVSLRHALYDLGLKRTHKFDVTIVSVGNITAGGTGKTPHVEYIHRLLSEDSEYKVAVLSRGYKRNSRGFKYVEGKSEMETVGDEPLQIKRNCPTAIVAVSRNRSFGIKQILKDYPDTDVILLDDGFQRRDVAKDLDILLIDYNRPIHEDSWLPYGTLRDSKRRVSAANMVIYTKCPDDLKPYSQRILKKYVDATNAKSVLFTKLVYLPLQAVFNRTTILKRDPEAILAISGIANPDLFVESIQRLYKNAKVSSLTFPDHHNFSRQDHKKITARFNAIEDDNKIIITTQKDAVRMLKDKHLSESLKSSIFVLPIKIEFTTEQGADEFRNKILQYIEENRGNRRLYSKRTKWQSGL
ncbi:MAG: tetraacyldisaccharide 4'-kinase [Bacteroidales bacterium]